MAGILDADTHIAEPLEMWDCLDPEWRPRRPVIVQVPDDTLYQESDHMWLIDGQIFPKSAGRGGNRLVTPTAQTGVQRRADVKSRELTDLALRFEAMVMTGVEAQVVYPTLFLAFLTFDAELEVALCRAYNRFLAGVSERSEGRIRWVVVPPLRDIDASIAELRFGREHGACGVFFRGIEKDRTLDDPYFFPVYEEAQALDLAICVHQGQGAPGLNNLVDITRSHTFTHGRLPPLSAFRNIVANRIPELFTELRFGFIETGASWVPFVLHQLSGTMQVDADWWGPRAVRRVPVVGLLRGGRGPAVPAEVHWRRPCGDGHGLRAPRQRGEPARRRSRRRRSRWCGRSVPGRSTAAAPSTSCSSTTRVRCTAWRRGRFLFRSR